ncbi:hypothetical protein [Bacillus sp. RAR_GA_16]|uniref:hypothetical protein n=1 Tax=Bacillus sp. RAR_GA_16 TaxID=2876774 RepID=UPI001CCED0C2|nr:hypothetical protein [Bacillus sp. RAR_GA_16]MCA0172800.1 hypothetical protein [Bacillus sp. RAR_GA_16]
MKKNTISFLLMLLIATGCGTAATENSSGEPSEAKSGTNEVSAMNELDFIHYRPETGVTKTFTSEGKQLFTEYIVDQNGEYVQRMITLGEMQTTQIVKWTEDRAAVVEESQLSSKESMLDGYESVEEVQALLDHSEKTEGLEMATVDTVEVPYGSFHDVIKVTKKQDGMMITLFYAKGVGMIKQVYETQDSSEKEVAELAEIQ